MAKLKIDDNRSRYVQISEIYSRANNRELVLPEGFARILNLLLRSYFSQHAMQYYPMIMSLIYKLEKNSSKRMRKIWENVERNRSFNLNRPKENYFVSFQGSQIE